MYSNLEVITLPLVQHKRAVCWFYRFLSIVYDTYINLLFWTERMRTQVLTLTRLDEPNLQVIDVGSGTGFTTQWIVQFVNSRQITCVDQSPHQQKKANAMPDLNGCTFAIEDAEQIPYETNRFDRHVSASGLEYWPDPAQGIWNVLFDSCSRNPVAIRNENDIEFWSVNII